MTSPAPTTTTIQKQTQNEESFMDDELRGLIDVVRSLELPEDHENNNNENRNDEEEESEDHHEDHHHADYTHGKTGHACHHCPSPSSCHNHHHHHNHHHNTSDTTSTTSEPSSYNDDSNESASSVLTFLPEISGEHMSKSSQFEECSIHGRRRGIEYLVPTEDGKYRCAPGFTCKTSCKSPTKVVWYFCECCLLVLNSEHQYNIHIKGSRHINRVAELTRHFKKKGITYKLPSVRIVPEGTDKSDLTVSLDLTKALKEIAEGNKKAPQQKKK